MTPGMKNHDPIPEELESLASETLECAFKVHRTLGPGLLESVYEGCLCHELSRLAIPHERQIDLPVEYGDLRFEAGLRIDVWVDRRLILELKAVETIRPVHEAQLLTYMKLTHSRLGFLITFNVATLKNGIRRRIL